MDFNREWTVFALDAEANAFGFQRIAKAHNDACRQFATKELCLRSRVEKLEESNTTLTIERDSARLAGAFAAKQLRSLRAEWGEQKQPIDAALADTEEKP